MVSEICSQTDRLITILRSSTGSGAINGTKLTQRNRKRTPETRRRISKGAICDSNENAWSPPGKSNNRWGATAATEIKLYPIHTARPDPTKLSRLRRVGRCGLSQATVWHSLNSLLISYSQTWNWVTFCDPATQWPGNPATRRPSWPGDPAL